MLKRILILSAAAALLLAAGPRAVSAQDFQVVVNASSPVSQLSRAQVSNIFQKKERRLGSENAAPVDLKTDVPVRETFSQAIHGRSASAIDSYWMKQVFAGRNDPPEQKSSEEDVLEYVRSHPGAIGYVSAGTVLGAGVKALSVTG